jgi:hypothetical protein
LLDDWCLFSDDPTIQKMATAMSEKYLKNIGSSPTLL